MESVKIKMTKNMGFSLVGSTYAALNPKALMLLAAAKCAGMTTVMLMRKMRLHPKNFEITCSGTLSTDTVSCESVFTAVDFVYNAECSTIDEQARISNAVNLAHEKYCGMVKMMRRVASVSHEVYIHSTEPLKVK